MQLVRYRFFLVLALLPLWGGCGFFNDQPGPIDATTDVGSSVNLSTEAAFYCMTEGDFACAEENYCANPADQATALRCCLSKSLHTLFSENTQQLGEKLGYHPLPFKELRELSPQQILEQRALPLGELFLTSKEQAVDTEALFALWSQSLHDREISAMELRNHLRVLGQDLENTLQCMNTSLNGFEQDELQEEIFATDAGIPLTARDLLFAKFAVGTSSYLLQALADYDWGVESFSEWPLTSSFLADINGAAAEGDSRWGDLSAEGEATIANRFSLLVHSFDALKAFSALKDSPSETDRYLNWRFTGEAQTQASALLKGAYDSLKTGEWQDLPEANEAINLFPLATASQIPNGTKIPLNLKVLVTEDDQSIRVSEQFLKSFLASVYQMEALPDPVPPKGGVEIPDWVKAPQ